ncbi:MAG: acyltransferase [Clostridia bacterium]|nr:acyltransferase [Clostridia bacterium]
MTPALKQRNSAMELLRILAMFLIIFSHYISHGTGENLDGSFNSIITLLFQTGNIGTDIFILLSGYFLINSKFSFKKVFTLIFQVVFYSICFYAVCLLTSAHSFSFSDTITAFLPTSFSLYWFFTTYIVMYLLSPFVNKFLNSVSKETHLKVLLATTFLWVILPTFTTRSFAGSELTLFLTLYIIGAYIRKYPNNLLTKNRNDIILIVLCTCFIAVFALGVLKIMPSFAEYATYFYSRQSLFVVLLSAGLLSFFSKIKPFCSKALNTVSGTIFGIYLIHDNRFFRGFMWNEIFETDKFGTGNFILVHMLCCAVTVFVACFVIEFIRNKIIEKPVLILYDKVYDKLSPKISSVLKKISE